MEEINMIADAQGVASPSWRVGRVRPTREFSTLSYPEEKQLGIWREIMSDVYYSLEIQRNRIDGLRARIRQFDIGDVSITNFDADQQRVFRTRSRISGDPDDSFVFVMPARKELYFSQNGRSGFVKPGGYVLVSTSEFYELSCPDGFMNWTVKIPGDAFRKRLPCVDDFTACRFKNNPRMAYIARKYLVSLGMAFGSETPPNASSLARNLIDMLALVIESEVEDCSGETQSQLRIRRRIMTYIRDHIDDPNLTPRSIADANGISVSYLYKLFSACNMTVGSFIIAERLQLAYERLSVGGHARSTVAEIAYSSGFSNLSHFSRVFREKYSISPSAVRKQPF